MLHVLQVYRAAACDVTGGVSSLNFDATELRIFKDNLGSPSNPNLQYGHFEPYHWFYKNVQCLVLMYGILWCMATSCHAP